MVVDKFSTASRLETFAFWSLTIHHSNIVFSRFVNSLVMRAAANKPHINIVAVNDPFIPVEYMEYMYK